ncbi:hypothetical protein ESCO_004588 [Escovopsis weberi]|uniref:Uncharacterized protein n=1 Tax=Escovopsis weberi TaxID=150374 RepID=A0A0M8MZC8_ESCWE|nr:hypothetical protein ESCO_004588 [Escovopsis weberi]
MHSKLQILKFEGYIRIVIPTGNFVPYDWGEDGIMENTELKYFLEALGVGDRMIASLSRYDFSKTANYAFVHSM